MTSKLNKQQAGRLGGQTTLKKHGREHFANIGRKGAQAMHKKYRLVPIGIGDMAFVDRDTGQVLPRTINGLHVQEYK